MDYLAQTIYATIVGSHAYGLSTPESDLDIKGVLIPPEEYIFGYLNNFEQHIRSTPSDLTIYNIDKFFKLAADCNPNIIELLYTDDKFVLCSTPYWEMIAEHRDKFLSMKAAYKYTGYAFSQLKRIKRHRGYLLNPPKKKPEREDYKLNKDKREVPKAQLGAAEHMISELIHEWMVGEEELPKGVKEKLGENVNHLLRVCWKQLVKNEHIEVDYEDLAWYAAAEELGYSSNFVEYMANEKAYKNALKNWDSYINWKEGRNPKRAALEEKFGYDTKHSSHLVRLLLMGEEILTEGKVKVFREDAEILKGIKEGQWTFDELVEWAYKKQDVIYKIVDDKSGVLPNKVDSKFLNNLCIKIQKEFLYGSYR